MLPETSRAAGAYTSVPPPATVSKRRAGARQRGDAPGRPSARLCPSMVGKLLMMTGLGVVSVLTGAGCSAGSSGGSKTTPGAAAGSGAGTGGSASQQPELMTGGTVGSPILDPISNGEGGSDDCDSVLPVTYRDFTEKHPDFECCNGGYGVYQGMIEKQLGPERKPVFKSGIGDCILQQVGNCDPSWTMRPPVIKDAESFASWYVTTAGVNAELEKRLELSETSAGSGVFVFDSSAFFPLGPDEGLGPSPAGRDKNFLFTTEIHLRFQYAAGQKFTFSGDDDMWIFVNDKLALDLGGLHAKFEAAIDFDTQAGDLGIVAGRSYNMDVFHAERHTEASNFRIETNISCFEPVVVK